MAILTTLIDRTTVSRAGDALLGVTVATLAHSLATTPDAVLVNIRSIQGIGHQPSIVPMGLGANASLSTVGYAVGSTASAPTIMYDALAIFFHSIIR